MSGASDDVRELFAAHLATSAPQGPTSVPVRQADVRGRVVERPEGDAAIAAMDRLSRTYIGAPFPMRDPETTVAFLVALDRARHRELPFAVEA